MKKVAQAREPPPRPPWPRAPAGRLSARLAGSSSPPPGRAMVEASRALLAELATHGDDALQPWLVRIRSAIAMSRQLPGGNFVQVATVDADGLPHCRTMVFRGFLAVEERGGRQALQLITDSRSEKVAHMGCNPACELVWWLSASSEQYRVAGEFEAAGPEAEGELQAARQAMWLKLSDAAREQYWWELPGAKYVPQHHLPKGGRDESGEVLPPPDCFLLLLLWPRDVKYLRLTDTLSVVDRLDAESGRWISTRVNP